MLEKAAFEVTNKSGSYELWVTKAYHAAMFHSKRKIISMPATFQSIVNNAKLEDLRREAERKLSQVTEEEKKNGKIWELITTISRY